MVQSVKHLNATLFQQKIKLIYFLFCYLLPLWWKEAVWLFPDRWQAVPQVAWIFREENGAVSLSACLPLAVLWEGDLLSCEFQQQPRCRNEIGQVHLWGSKDEILPQSNFCSAHRSDSFQAFLLNLWAFILQLL